MYYFFLYMEAQGRHRLIHRRQVDRNTEWNFSVIAKHIIHRDTLAIPSLNLLFLRLNFINKILMHLLSVNMTKSPFCLLKVSSMFKAIFFRHTNEKTFKHS